jgi:glyoxylase I family protein
MILGVHHTAIAVSNIEEGMAFYCDVLGFELVMNADIPSGIDVMTDALGVPDSEFKVRMIKKGNSILEMFEFGQSEAGDVARPPNKIGITHIALCTDDPESDYAMLEKAGVVFNAALMGGNPDRFAYGRDPFGNVIELLEHKPGAPDGRDFS